MNESITEEETLKHLSSEKKSIYLSALTSTCSIWDPLEPVDVKLDLWNLDYLPSPLIDQLTCSICQCVFVEPYSTKCGHTFCKHCLFQALSRSASATASYTSSVNSITNNENRNSNVADFSVQHQQSLQNADPSDATSTSTPNTTSAINSQQLPSSTVTIHSKCPIDRSPLSTNSSDISPAPVVLSNLANDIMVYCPNKKHGCKHTCQRWMLESHLLQDCQYTLFKCNAVKDDGSICKESLERKFIMAARELSIQDYKDTHQTENTSNESKNVSTSPVKLESEPSDVTKSEDLNVGQNPRIYLSDLTVYCPHETMECPSGCGMSFSRYKLSSHLKNECPEYESECYVCGAAVSRKDLEQHLENTCPESMISCKAADIGCMWVGKRSEFHSTHKSLCKYLQFQPILNQQNNRITKLENENKSLRYHIDRLLTRFPQSDIPNVINNDNSSISRSLLSETNIPDSTSADNQRRLSNNSSQSQGRQQPLSSFSTQFTESDIMHIFMEGQRLREDVDRIGNQLGDMEIRHSISMMQENFRTGEEINSLRALINSLRHQIHFLLAERRSWAVANMHQQQQFQQQSSQLSSRRSVDSLDQAIGSDSAPAPRRLSGKYFIFLT